MAASLFWHEILQHKSTFKSYLEGDINDAVPSLIFQFVCMIKQSSAIKWQLEQGASKSDLETLLLLLYNCSAKYKKIAETHRHKRDHKTSFDCLWQNQKVTYHWYASSALLDEAVLAKYFEDSVVCPPISKKGLFITSAIDIIDYNPTTRTQTLTRQLLLPWVIMECITLARSQNYWT